MPRLLAIGAVAVLLMGCQQPSVPNHARITDFKADPSFLTAGVTGRLCYGVENGTKVDLNPHVEDILPASARCLDITPHQTTVFTLTASGTDGKAETKSVEVKVGPPQPRIADLAATPISVKPGHQVKVCFKVENARSVSAKPGKLDRKTNCLVDHPKKTTTYQVIARGDDNELDTATVTVTVLR